MAVTSSTPSSSGPPGAGRSRRPSELARSIRAKPTSRCSQAESSAAYASGHVLFARDDTLMAQPFDPETRQLAGEAFPVAERVSQRGQPLHGRLGVGEWHAGVRQRRCPRRASSHGAIAPVVASARWANRRRTSTWRCHRTNAAWRSPSAPATARTSTSGSSTSPAMCARA